MLIEFDRISARGIHMEECTKVHPNIKYLDILIFQIAPVYIHLFITSLTTWETFILFVGGFNGFYGNGLIVGGFNGFCGKILIVVIS